MSYPQSFTRLVVTACWLSIALAQGRTTEAVEVSVREGFEPPPLRLNLPDLAHHTPAAVRSRLPSKLEGRAKLAPVAGERFLEEAFRRELGVELAKRQGREEAVFIAVEAGALTLDRLVAQLDDPRLARESEGTVTLRLPILVRHGATLVIDGERTPSVRLAEDAGALIANAGGLFVLGSEVIGWNDKSDGPARFVEKSRFRPYLASYIRSETYLVNSRFAHLGFSAPTAYGLSLSTQPERKHGEPTEDSPTGKLIGNVFEDLYYGFYSYEARDVAIVDNVYRDSIVYGIDPHDRSTRLIIAGNTTTGTKERHGIIGSRGVSNSHIWDNKSYANAGSGVMLDRNCYGNLVANNEVYGNNQGIAVYESSDNRIVGNLVVGNAKSAVRIRNSTDITVRENRLVGHGDYAIEVSARLLSDHDKRQARGDRYTQELTAKLYDNGFGANRGLMEADGLNELLIAGVAIESDPQQLAERFGVTIDPDSIDDYKLGGDLKPSRDEVRWGLKRGEGKNVIVIRPEPAGL
ncbi:Poly(beta-D-mannuronate) C5 epimerase precursor [Planctomycetes bacterium MalM25]|nr:Poly(beta-D-mannuronate) C5 epimerase precursor [Planctomycetes bacterium MalM25]